MIEKEGTITTKEITLHMGPQHPSAHGVLHLYLDMQGERIVKAEPDIGYLHRGTEKIAEDLFYPQFVPYTDRLDYMAGMTNNLAYVQAVEKLLEIELPERAKYIRVVASELSRIGGHLPADPPAGESGKCRQVLQCGQDPLRADGGNLRQRPVSVRQGPLG